MGFDPTMETENSSVQEAIDSAEIIASRTVADLDLVAEKGARTIKVAKDQKEYRSLLEAIGGANREMAKNAAIVILGNEITRLREKLQQTEARRAQVKGPSDIRKGINPNSPEALALREMNKSILDAGTDLEELGRQLSNLTA